MATATPKPSSSQETAARIKALLKATPQEDRADAARLDELRRIFAKLIQQGDLSFSSEASGGSKAQQKWNTWLQKQHERCVQQLMQGISTKSRRTSVRTLWGLIASSPHTTQQGHVHLHTPLLIRWLSALVAMPSFSEDDKSMQHLLAEDVLGQRDVQYYTLRGVTKWANDQYRHYKNSDVDDEEEESLRQDQADRMLHILMMIPFATSQKALDSSNSKYLFPPPQASTSSNKSGLYEDQEDGEEEKKESSDEDNSSDDNEEESSDEEETPSKRRRTNQPSTVVVPKHFAYQDIKCQLGELSKAWMAILRLPLSTSSLKKALPFLSNHVLPKIRSPLRFADLFMHAYGGADGSSSNEEEDIEEDTEKETEKETQKAKKVEDITSPQRRTRTNPIISLLALDGLFYLMTQHRLEYPQFYSQLYALLKPSLFYVKYRSRFFALLQKCLLRNEMLPAHLVAAFLKRLLQCALQTPPPGALFILALSSNLLRKHEECAALIHRTSSCTGNPNNDGDGSDGNEDNNKNNDGRMEDAYDPNTDDPVECRALESSLWELHALEKHYHPAVATLAKSIGREDPKSPMLRLDEMAQHSYASLIEQERKRQVKKTSRNNSGGNKRKYGGYDKHAVAVTPVTFVKPSALFTDNDVFAGVLKIPTVTK